MGSGGQGMGESVVMLLYFASTIAAVACVALGIALHYCDKVRLDAKLLESLKHHNARLRVKLIDKAYAIENLLEERECLLVENRELTARCEDLREGLQLLTNKTAYFESERETP